MKRVRCLVILLFLGAAMSFSANSFADEDTMPSDDMGNGAEFDDTGDRATQIDENGDGDYNAGDGSVLDEPESEPVDSDSGE